MAWRSITTRFPARSRHGLTAWSWPARPSTTARRVRSDTRAESAWSSPSLGGGLYADGTPFAGREHAETYLRDIFALMGINDLELVIAEGLAFGPEACAAGVQGAMDRIEAIPAQTL
ncbi:MAG: NAD(P)H-dependent oxidoreductase [Achromobacter ruhlandii]|nr:NAD(P)H-dependent oxidoreductase [Achromobacter ruhlandii]MCI1839169.1 NAD(P)H-dependent oxidoreductase [Achromobacter ruhlandii]